MKIGDEITIISNLEQSSCIVCTTITEFHYNGYLEDVDITERGNNDTTYDICVRVKEFGSHAEWVFVSSLVQEFYGKLIILLKDENN